MKKGFILLGLLTILVATCCFVACNKDCVHEIVVDKGIEATCTTSGLTEGKHCSICEEILLEQIEIPATGHQLVLYDSKAPSCTDVGWNTYMECEKCDYTTKVEIPAQHTLAEAVVENKIEATCLENGSFDSVVYCSKCNVEVSRETKPVPATGHTLVSYPSQEPTCTENGWGAYEACKKCDYTTKVEIPCQHTPSEKVIENVVPSTCTILGSFDNVIYCLVCEEELSRTKETTPTLGHDLQEFDAVEPTCTEKGWSAGQACTRCNATLREEIPAKGHAMVSHEGKAPTCTEPGWQAYDTCSRCDYTTYKEIPAGHKLIKYNAKAPSCNSVGWNAYERCSNCDYTTYEELPKIDHNYDLTNNIGRCFLCGFEEFTFKYDNAAFGSVMFGKEQLILTGLGKDFKGTHVVIPEKLGNRSVDAIDNSTFKNNTSIRSITIPASIVDIYGLDSIPAFNLWNGGAFEGCTNLTNVYYLGTIEQWCSIKYGNWQSNPMYYATNLYIGGKLVSGSIEISNSVLRITEYAFNNCNGITDIQFEGTKEQWERISIGDGNEPIKNANIHFSQYTVKENIVEATCTTEGHYDLVVYKTSDNTEVSRERKTTAKLSHVYLNDGTCSNCGYQEFVFSLNADGATYAVVGIGKDFSGTKVTIPTSFNGKAITAIEARAFDNNDMIVSVVIPEGVISIGEHAFSYCNNLTNVTIPESVTTICESAFRGSTGLTSVTIGKNITSISSAMFNGCTGLKRIIISDSVTYIGDYAFYDCNGLTDIYYTGTEEQWNAITIAAQNEELKNATIHYNYVVEEQ